MQNEPMNNQVDNSQPTPAGSFPPQVQSTDASSMSPAAPETPMAPTQSTSPQPEKNKNGRGLIICLAILIIIALAIAGVFAYLYFNNQPSQKQINPSSNQSSKIDDTSEEDETEDEGEEETTEKVITDTYILNDLNEKMAILHNYPQFEVNDVIALKGLLDSPTLYTEGGLEERLKILYVIESLSDKRHILSLAEKEAMATSMNYSDEDRQMLLRATEQYGIDGDIVAAKYEDVFGEKLVKNALNNTSVCPPYRYFQSNNLYAIDIRGGCGGTSSGELYLYKKSYTMSSDYAYVYVVAASLEPSMEQQNIMDVYCDVTNTLSCGTLQYGAEFVFDKSNLDRYSEYRFIFKKSTGGTYYFVKTERIH